MNYGEGFTKLFLEKIVVLSIIFVVWIIFIWGQTFASQFYDYALLKRDFPFEY